MFVLRPHRSLSPAGFVILMSAYGLVSFITGLTFYRIGAWPVLGFCGLDVALVYLAFRLNYRSAAETETIEIGRDELIVRLQPMHGRARPSLSFNPYWVRVELTELAGGVSRLSLVSKGKGVVIARFLSDPERRELAAALTAALAAARNPALSRT